MESISPKYLSRAGGELVEIAMSGPNSNTPESITIEGVPCSVRANFNNNCYCVTGAQIGQIDYEGPELVIKYSDFGYANTNGIKFVYTVLWSQHT